jgi:hypothetical protein
MSSAELIPIRPESDFPVGLISKDDEYQLAKYELSLFSDEERVLAQRVKPNTRSHYLGSDEYVFVDRSGVRPCVV